MSHMFQVYHPHFAYNQAIGATTATNSRQVPMGISVMRLTPSVDCYVRISANTLSADTTSCILVTGGTTEYFLVKQGQQVSVIAAGASTGTLNVAEMGR